MSTNLPPLYVVKTLQKLQGHIFNLEVMEFNKLYIKKSQLNP